MGYISGAGRAKLNPPGDRVLKKGQKLVLMSHEPVDSPVEMHQLAAAPDIGDWSPDQYTLKSQDEEPLGEQAAIGLASTQFTWPLLLQLQGMGTNRLQRGDDQQDIHSCKKPRATAATAVTPHCNELFVFSFCPCSLIFFPIMNAPARQRLYKALSSLAAHHFFLCLRR